MNYTLFNDTYVMYQLLEFIDESSIICLCKASKKLNEICKQYLEIEDDKRFEVDIENWSNNRVLLDCCENNDIIRIKKLIKTEIDWGFGLCGACRGGHIDIIKFMIEKCARDCNNGLLFACEGSNIDIVKFMIEKGATHFNGGLLHSCGSHINIDIEKLMIEKGATCCSWCHKSMEEHLKKVY